MHEKFKSKQDGSKLFEVKLVAPSGEVKDRKEAWGDSEGLFTFCVLIWW